MRRRCGWRARAGAPRGASGPVPAGCEIIIGKKVSCRFSSHKANGPAPGSTPRVPRRVVCNLIFGVAHVRVRNQSNATTCRPSAPSCVALPLPMPAVGPRGALDWAARPPRAGRRAEATARHPNDQGGGGGRQACPERRSPTTKRQRQRGAPARAPLCFILFPCFSRVPFLFLPLSRARALLGACLVPRTRPPFGRVQSACP